MTLREITSPTPGPVTVDLSLLDCGGTITIRAVRTPEEHATITVHTDDDTGPSADTVRNADLHTTDTGLHTTVHGHSGAGSTVITSRHGRVQTVIGHNTGSVIQVGGNIIGGNVFASGSNLTIVNGQVTSGHNVTVVQGGSPVRITALVPAGSTVTARTTSGDIAAHGKLRQITATTVSGTVTVDTAGDITARTTSGDILLNRTDLADATTVSGDLTIADFGGTARLTTTSGDIRVHATTGGDLKATTVSGDIRVTATQEALADDLDVHPRTVSGRIEIPPRRIDTSGPRRRVR